MNTYLISYDLRGKGKNYQALYDAIKAYGTWCHVHESTWAIVSSSSSEQIRDNLAKHLDRDDTIFVVRCAKGDAAWRGLTEQQSTWLKSNLS